MQAGTCERAIHVRVRTWMCALLVSCVRETPYLQVAGKYLRCMTALNCIPFFAVHLCWRRHRLCQARGQELDEQVQRFTATTKYSDHCLQWFTAIVIYCDHNLQRSTATMVCSSHYLQRPAATILCCDHCLQSSAAITIYSEHYLEGCAATKMCSDHYPERSAATEIFSDHYLEWSGACKINSDHYLDRFTPWAATIWNCHDGQQYYSSHNVLRVCKLIVCKHLEPFEMGFRLKVIKAFKHCGRNAEWQINENLSCRTSIWSNCKPFVPNGTVSVKAGCAECKKDQWFSSSTAKFVKVFSPCRQDSWSSPLKRLNVHNVDWSWHSHQTLCRSVSICSKSTKIQFESTTEVLCQPGFTDEISLFAAVGVLQDKTALASPQI